MGRIVLAQSDQYLLFCVLIEVQAWQIEGGVSAKFHQSFTLWLKGTNGYLKKKRLKPSKQIQYKICLLSENVLGLYSVSPNNGSPSVAYNNKIKDKLNKNWHEKDDILKPKSKLLIEQKNWKMNRYWVGIHKSVFNP